MAFRVQKPFSICHFPFFIGPSCDFVDRFLGGQNGSTKSLETTRKGGTLRRTNSQWQMSNVQYPMSNRFFDWLLSAAIDSESRLPLSYLENLGGPTHNKA